MFWIELIIVLAIIFIGVRIGGTYRRYVPCDGRRNRNVYYDIYSPCYSF